MNVMESLPVGAAICSPETAEALVWTNNGWQWANLFTLRSVMPVAHDIFSEAAKTALRHSCGSC